MAELDVAEAARRLEANAYVFTALVQHVDAEQASWKPTPNQWSVVEVLGHLADEDAEDFRSRLELTLERPGEPWPHIEPEEWAASRHYNERELADALSRFVTERRRSVEWLRALENPDWERSYEHPRAGTLRAGDLLASWLDHDLIHIRQITRLQHQWLVERSLPYRTEYAGGF